MTKVGIIRCQEQSDDCAGWGWFPALRNKTGAFATCDSVELIGFDTRGGCGRSKADKIVAKAKRLKEKGASVIHLGYCLLAACPDNDLHIMSLQEQVGIPIVEKTHPTH